MVKFNVKTLISFGFCLAAGIGAFISERNEQKLEEEVETLKARVEDLEKR